MRVDFRIIQVDSIYTHGQFSCMYEWKRDAAEYSQSHKHVEVLQGRRVQSLDAQAKAILLDGEPCYPGPSRHTFLSGVLASACAGHADRVYSYSAPAVFMAKWHDLPSPPL